MHEPCHKVELGGKISEKMKRLGAYMAKILFEITKGADVAMAKF